MHENNIIPLIHGLQKKINVNKIMHENNIKTEKTNHHILYTK